MANKLENGLSKSIFAKLVIFGASKNGKILKRLKENPDVMKLEGGERGSLQRGGEGGVEEWQVRLPGEEVSFLSFSLFFLFSFSHGCLSPLKAQFESLDCSVPSPRNLILSVFDLGNRLNYMQKHLITSNTLSLFIFPFTSIPSTSSPPPPFFARLPTSSVVIIIGVVGPSSKSGENMTKKDAFSYLKEAKKGWFGGRSRVLVWEEVERIDDREVEQLVKVIVDESLKLKCNEKFVFSFLFFLFFSFLFFFFYFLHVLIFLFLLFQSASPLFNSIISFKRIQLCAQSTNDYLGGSKFCMFFYRKNRNSCAFILFM